MPIIRKVDQRAVDRIYDLADGEKARLHIGKFYVSESGLVKVHGEISWPNKKNKKFVGVGIDYIDAFLNILMYIEVYLGTEKSFRRGNLKWLGESELGLISSYLKNEHLTNYKK